MSYHCENSGQGAQALTVGVAAFLGRRKPRFGGRQQ
jgi:hypothetical protein